MVEGAFFLASFLASSQPFSASQTSGFDQEKVGERSPTNRTNQCKLGETCILPPRFVESLSLVELFGVQKVHSIGNLRVFEYLHLKIGNLNWLMWSNCWFLASSDWGARIATPHILKTWGLGGRFGSGMLFNYAKR